MFFNLVRIIVIFAMLVVLLPIESPAADSYFSADSISPALLSLPLTSGSQKQKQELAYIKKLQQNPDKDEIAKALNEREMKPEMIAEAVLPALKRSDFPVLYAMLDKVGNTSHKVTDKAKKYWHTDRPYIVDKNIKPLISAHSNYSYPSGHTSGSYTWAYVMSMLLPEYSQDFLTKAQSIAHHRALVGMHFPHDLEGGRQLALLTVGGLLQNREFLADLAKARKEYSGVIR